MTATNLPEQNTAYLNQQLEKYAQQGFTGRLDIAAVDRSWNLFFCLGRLVWATDSCYSNRRFRRVWQQTCPQVLPNLSGENIRSKQQTAICANYELFRTIAKQGQLSQESIQAMVRRNCHEVFFDILQQEGVETLFYQASPDGGLEKVSTLMSGLLWPRQIFPYAYQEWMDWQAAGLQEISPHEVPSIAQPEKLQQMTAATTYQVLEKAIDGRRCLRDLAVATNKQLWRLGKSLLPYFRQRVIKLTTVSDFSSAIASPRISTPTKIPQQLQQQPTPSKTSYQSQPERRIACIDDSAHIQKQMQHIVSQAGWQFIEIQDSIKALPSLLESLPHLIFLDLVMPIANGYEVCAQIRRVRALQSIPVVILTSQDGTIDRMRARFVGANAFLSKPIQPERVLAIAQQHIQF
jgi:chemotaxis family two-component system response regulator PixG